MTEPPERLRIALASRYRIDRELGAGGMAVVFLAEDLRHHRRVALKVLRPELGEEIGPERFLREIETAARLAHPHILPLHDSGEADGFLFYVMPYVEGESLRARLTREKQLPLDNALQIAREVADALSYAHSQGVVHRDIKPENILLQGGHAVVADFGIARAVAVAGAEARTATLTAAGVAIGTPAYMSPEQATGSADVDGRSDLYSLGCVLYEMLAGQPPFTGPSVESLVQQHLTAEPPSITTIRPAVPPWVAVAIQRALAKTPADRFSPVALFAEALAHRDLTTAMAVAPAASVRRARRARRLALFGGAAVVVVAGALLLLRTVGRTPAPPERAHTRSEIAVLPFQNLSADDPNAYFAGGLHDELLTQLSKVAALKVISRTSVMGYQDTSKPLKAIAKELGVGSVVEGSVQIIGGRLRVNVQLIDAATDEHLWAERYDRTLDDAFAIQSDVARQIVSAVGVALSSVEAGRLAAAPTTNAEAYRLYLQGRDYVTRPGLLIKNQEIGEQFLRQAVTLDPTFALAHAELSEVHGRIYFWRHDRSPMRVRSQREEAELALRLAPNLPQAHVALGQAYYLGELDYRRALAEFQIALEGLPSDAQLWTRIGYLNRRLGDWDQVLTAFERAAKLDPRSADVFMILGGRSFLLLHRYADAIRAFDHARELAPELQRPSIEKALTYVAWKGETDSLRAALSRLPAEVELGGPQAVTSYWVQLLLWERNAGGVLQMLRTRQVDVFAFQESYLPGVLYAAWAHQLRGDRAAALVAFDSARVRLDVALRELPGDWRVHAGRGLALAGSGLREEALREARWLEKSIEYRKDAVTGPAVAEDRARILAQAGDAEGALDEIERLLAGPSWISVHSLRLDPLWDPIRNHPRFKKLLVKGGGQPGATDVLSTRASRR